MTGPEGAATGGALANPGGTQRQGSMHRNATRRRAAPRHRNAKRHPNDNRQCNAVQRRAALPHRDAGNRAKRVAKLALGWAAAAAALTTTAAPSGATDGDTERPHDGEPLVVASKNFNEGYILAEILAQLLETGGFTVERRFGLGGTVVCYGALLAGEVDVYPEYTGTLARAILGREDSPDVPTLNAAVAPAGLELLPAFGYNNTYVLATTRAVATREGLATVSDLARARQLRFSVSHEFLERSDGWPGLSRTYGFDWAPAGIEHGLAYQALADGAIDVTDAYSTDGELKRYDLVMLRDDKGFFPEYFAAPLVRADLPAAAKARLRRLAGTLNEADMQALNEAVLFDEADFAGVAARHLSSLGIESEGAGPGPWETLGRNTLRHLELTAIALIPAVAIGVGMSILVFRVGWLSRAVIYGAGLLQTIPSIALLAFMIPLFGIGAAPAIVALFLYSLLPIARNTVTALVTVDPVLLRVAKAMGLTRWQELRHVLLPLAAPSMLAGARTAAVISIGTATLAAFIGAGGLGDPIVTGLALNNHALILQGAVPAALLAVAVEFAFEGVQRTLTPRHLRAART